MEMSESYDLLLCMVLVNHFIIVYFIGNEIFYKLIMSQLADIVNEW
jgi:hypothetical protein